MARSDDLDTIRNAIAILTHEDATDDQFAVLFTDWTGDDVTRFVVAVRGVLAFIGEEIGADQLTELLDRARAATIALDARGSD